MKRLFLLIIALIFVGLWGYEELVESFYERSIHLSSWPKKSYEALSCRVRPDEAQKLLDQPFTYLGKGRQFFVFESDDGKYVLKFIKCQRIDVPQWYKSMPLPAFLDSHRQARLAYKQEKIEGIFASCAIAACEIPDETGVVFAHLSTKPEVKKKVTLIDKLGIEHSINIDNVPFVIQKRAELVIPTISALIDMKEYEEVYKRFDQLIDLIANDVARGIYDIDSGSLERDNVAFLETRAIHVDIGTFIHKSSINIQEQFDRFATFLVWLKTKDPLLEEVFRKKLDMRLSYGKDSSER